MDILNTSYEFSEQSIRWNNPVTSQTLQVANCTMNATWRQSD